MRTTVYVGVVLLAVLLVVLLVKTSVPAPSPVGSTPFPSTTVAASLPSPTATSTSPNLLSSGDFHIPPLSYTSDTGVTVEITELAYGPDCLRLQTRASGLPAPDGVAIEDAPIPHFSVTTLSDPLTSRPITLRPISGGGGGGQAADGSVFIGKGAVYEFAPHLSPEGFLFITVQIVTEQGLGFDAPLIFNVQATRSLTDNCRFQGGLNP